MYINIFIFIRLLLLSLNVISLNLCDIKGFVHKFQMFNLNSYEKKNNSLNFK